MRFQLANVRRPGTVQRLGQMITDAGIADFDGRRPGVDVSDLHRGIQQGCQRERRRRFAGPDVDIHEARPEADPERRCGSVGYAVGIARVASTAPPYLTWRPN